MLNKNVGILPTETMHVYVISNENMTKARSVDTIFSGKYTLYLVCATPSTIESFVNLDDGGNCKYKTYSIEFSISRTLPKNHSLTLNIANHSGRQVNIANILFVTAPDAEIPTPTPTEQWPDGRKVEFYSEANFTGNLVATLTANYQPERDGVIAFRSFKEIRPDNLPHAYYEWYATLDNGGNGGSTHYDHDGLHDDPYYFTSLDYFNYLSS
ncbi:hypothetical protein ACLEUK_19670 [Pseudescherichia vulneris]